MPQFYSYPTKQGILFVNESRPPGTGIGGGSLLKQANYFWQNVKLGNLWFGFYKGNAQWCVLLFTCAKVYINLRRGVLAKNLHFKQIQPPPIAQTVNMFHDFPSLCHSFSFFAEHRQKGIPHLAHFVVL